MASALQGLTPSQLALAAELYAKGAGQRIRGTLKESHIGDFIRLTVKFNLFYDVLFGLTLNILKHGVCI